MPKRIAIISSHFPPENTAASNRLHSFFEILNMEYEVEVFHLLEKGEKANLLQDEINSIEQKAFSSSNFIVRFYFELKGAFSLLKLMRKKSHDYYLVSIPYMSLIFLPLFLNKKPVILDVRDVVWRYLGNGILGKSFEIVFDQIYKIVAKKCIAIIVTNKNQLDLLKSIEKKTNYEVIYNGITTEKFNIIDEIPNLNLSSKLTITYVGNVGLAQNLTILIDAASKLTDYKFNVIGDGSDFERVYKYAIDKKVSNVKFTGKLDWIDLIEYYKNTDILYAQLKKEFKSAIPSKLFEYLATGKAVIYGGSGAVDELTEEFEGLNIIEPDNYKALISTIQRLANDKSYFYKKNKAIIAQKFIRENSSRKLLKLYK